jgi:hypothetical protein
VRTHGRPLRRHRLGEAPRRVSDGEAGHVLRRSPSPSAQHKRISRRSRRL